MKAPSSLDQAIAWIREQSLQLNYGRASIEVVAHAGKITRIITATETATAAVPTHHAGIDHDRARV